MTDARWLVTADETEGRLARAELRVPPGGGEAAHAHPDGEERIELLAGTLTLEVGGCRIGLHAGDDVTVPAGVSHAWRNAGPDDLYLVVETRPSRLLAESVEALRAAPGVAHRSRADRGPASPVQYSRPRPDA